MASFWHFFQFADDIKMLSKWDENTYQKVFQYPDDMKLVLKYDENNEDSFNMQMTLK